MKKILSLLLVFTMLFSLAFVFSCNENDDGNDTKPEEPKVAVAKAVAKTNALNEYEAKSEITMDMEISVMGTKTTMQVPMSTTIKIKGADTQNPEVYTEIEMTMMGETINQTIYLKDGWSYNFDGEDGYKTEADDAEDYKETLKEMIKDIPVSLLENLSFEEVENGQKVTISIPNETFAQIFDDMIDTLTESYGSDMDVIISNAVVSIVISDGYIVSYNMEFDMEMEMDMGGITAEATAHVVSTTTITNPGQAVTIVPPQDYESYPEL